MATLVFFLAVACSILSQTPEFLKSGVDRYLKLTWLLPFIVLIFENLRAFVNYKLFFFYSFVIVFFLYCLTLESVTGIKYVGADVYNIAISLLVTVVSFAYWSKYGNERNLKTLVIILLITGLYLSITVYTQYLSVASLSERTYAFKAKNSMASILLNIIIVAISCYIPKNGILKVASCLSLLLMLVIIFMLKSRATLCGFFFIVFYYVVKYNNFKIRLAVGLVCLVVVIYILINPVAYEIIVEQILFGSRNASDIDDLSSGRVTLFMTQLKKIPGHEFFGTGNYYMDCFPLMMIVQYGIVGSGIVFAFLAKMAYTVTCKFKPRTGICLASYLLFWSAIVNCLFEAQPPFGPGIKCFLIWTMIGFSFATIFTKRKRQSLKLDVV